MMRRNATYRPNVGELLGIAKMSNDGATSVPAPASSANTNCTLPVRPLRGGRGCKFQCLPAATPAAETDTKVHHRRAVAIASVSVTTVGNTAPAVGPHITVWATTPVTIAIGR